MKLTKKLIETFIYKGPMPRRDVRWDDVLPGFGVRIYPSNKKTFILSYRHHNRKHLLTLGDVNVLTLDQARKMARQELVSVLGGTNPLDKKKKFAKDKSFKLLCEVYLRRYAKVHKKTWQEDERRIYKHLLPKWGSRVVETIKRPEIMAFHEQVGKTAPYEANRILRLLSKIFSLASQWGILDETASNPAKNIRLFKEEKRDRWLKPEEVPGLMKALTEEPNVSARHVLMMYLLTGARKTELLRAKWEDIDWERKELRLPETKSGKPHYIPLSTSAIDLLKQMNSEENNPYLFPGHIKGRSLVNITKPWKRVCQKADLKEVRIHDLRRTVGSWLAQSGNSLQLIGKILNHTNQSTTSIYARLAEDQGREALEAYGQKLLQAGKSKKLN